MTSPWIIAVVAVLAGATAAVSGAGIGSMLVPLLALRLDFKIAVAAVSIPHLVGGAVRLLLLRRHIEWRVVRSFGVACAIAALAGAALHDRVSSLAMTRAFAVLLAVAGLLGLAGLEERLEPGRVATWLGGAVAGFSGGIAGEQGGIRAVALLGFQLQREAFVATSTAVGVAIDVARTPVYLAEHWDAMRPVWPLVGTATAAVLVGTAIGHALLRRIPQKVFSRAVSVIVLVIAALLFLRPQHG